MTARTVFIRTSRKLNRADKNQPDLMSVSLIPTHPLQGR